MLGVINRVPIGHGSIDGAGGVWVVNEHLLTTIGTGRGQTHWIRLLKTTSRRGLVSVQSLVDVPTLVRVLRQMQEGIFKASILKQIRAERRGDLAAVGQGGLPGFHTLIL